MTNTPDETEEVSQVLTRINEAWQQQRLEDLPPLLHPNIVMVLPGFAGRAEGRAAVLAGFEDFNENARPHHFEESDRQVDVRGSAAVASFAFDVTYEREGQKYRSTGRDLWVFAKEEGQWLAVWRTMLDMAEAPA